MASVETVTKMRFIVADWNREGTPHLQKCLWVLGLKGSWQVAEEEDVRRRYHNLVKEIHPDKTKHELSHTVFPIVRSAYEELRKNAKVSKGFVPQRPSSLRATAASAVPSASSVRSASGNAPLSLPLPQQPSQPPQPPQSSLSPQPMQQQPSTGPEATKAASLLRLLYHPASAATDGTAADATAAARTPTDAEVAAIFIPSTGLCKWKVRREQCELTYGHGAEIVGRRVIVYWEADKRWYTGTVKSYDPVEEEHVVAYDDGDQLSESLHFVTTRWRFYEDPPSPLPKRPEPKRPAPEMPAPKRPAQLRKPPPTGKPKTRSRRRRRD